MAETVRRAALVVVVALAACAQLFAGCAATSPATRPAEAAAPSLAAAAPVPPAPPIAFDDVHKSERIAAFFAADGKQLAAWLDKSRAPGLAFGAVVDGKLVYFQGLGVREWSSKAKVEPDTAFRIASMTKSFVALAVLKLRDEGKLSLDDAAEKHLPELAKLRPLTADSPKLTIRHLLSHAAGLPEDNPSADLRMPMTDAEFDAVLARGLSFSAAPGTQFEYSNLGFALAGRIVQRLSGQRLQDYVTEQLLKPLGMTSTVWRLADVPPERRALGYGRKGAPTPGAGLARHDSDDEPHEEADIGDGTWAPIGGLWTTSSDYARYVAFQLAAWPPRDEPERGPVRRSSVRESHQVHRATSLWASRVDGALRVQAGGYGLGWGVSESCDFDRVVSHSGGLPGYGSYVVLLPEHGLGLFAMTNLTYSGPAGLLRETLHRLLQAGLLPSRPRTTSAQLLAARDALAALVDRWDAAAAAPLFDRTFTYYKPLEKIRVELEGLRARHGRCRADEITPENALRGKARLSCDRGSIEVTVTLTSEVPALIQSLSFESALPPDAALPPQAKASAEPRPAPAARGKCPR